MEQDLTKFRAEEGQEIKISFPDPDQVGQIVLNGQPAELQDGSLLVTSPTTDEAASKVDVAVDPASRTEPVEIQIHSGSRMFRHFILPGLDLARLRFVNEESGIKLVYCAVEDDYVIAGKNGKCPIHG
ncbi:MAG: hypothetical protein ABSD59_07845 [Terracidiphilus sp.]|jgi:hypothetical protein